MTLTLDPYILHEINRFDPYMEYDPYIDLHIGKPHALLYQIAKDRLGFGPGHCLMIGDRPDTEIAGAAALGMHTSLVRTGQFAPGTKIPDSLPVPDWDVDNLAALPHLV